MLFLLARNLCVCLHVCVYMSVGVHGGQKLIFNVLHTHTHTRHMTIYMEESGHLAGVSSLLPLCGFWVSNSGSQAANPFTH